MDLLIAFVLFIAAMVTTLVLGGSIILPLLAGLAAFIAVGIRKGFSFSALAGMGASGIRDAMIVMKVMCSIGFLTAVWRISGTITIFVYYGMKLIVPSLFLLIAFLLCCLLSYALGTSFGVAGTVGIIFMTLARSGGVNPVIAAGVIMSGVYFGDRGSPVSSSANMVAGVTDTDIFSNVKRMMKSGLLPFFLTLGIYTVLSLQNPLHAIDAAYIEEFESTFRLSVWSFIPAILMLMLPLMKVKVLHAMALSIVSGVLIAWLEEGIPLMNVLKICFTGYHPQETGLVQLLDGGGLFSMIQIMAMVLISGSYSGIFKGTKMLYAMQEKLSELCMRIGRFPVQLLLGTGLACMFCNQTIPILMSANLMRKPYEDQGGTNEELALDIENSVVLTSCLVPWSLGWSIPIGFFGVGAESMPFACYMYLVPLTWLITKKHLSHKL